MGRPKGSGRPRVQKIKKPPKPRMADRQSPQYMEVKKEVLKRDGGKCRKCDSKSNIEVHHIKRWASYPTLRFEPSNLITLCRKCHKSMWGQEEHWESLCMLLINKEKNIDINYRLWKLRQEEEDE